VLFSFEASYLGSSTSSSVEDLQVSEKNNIVLSLSGKVLSLFPQSNNGGEYEFLKALSFKKAQKPMKNPAHRSVHPIARKSRLKSLVASRLIRSWYEL